MWTYTFNDEDITFKPEGGGPIPPVREYAKVARDKLGIRCSYTHVKFLRVDLPYYLTLNVMVCI